MSRQLISHNDDLRLLQEEGYDLEIRSGYLLVKRVPHVNSQKEISYGTLVTDISLNGDKTIQPGTHVCHFVGDYPCDMNGIPIEKIRNSSAKAKFANDVEIDHSFSSKPPIGYYTDYHEKMVAYARILSHPAIALNPRLTATPFPPLVPEKDESVFHYLDTASTRSGIVAITQKLENEIIGIIGAGGTGSYVLDLVAKTPVKEIHLFDGDRFSQHNAFRSPGAASLAELAAEPQKVNRFSTIYSNMHRHIIPHDGYIDETNLDQLHALTFVFICLDNGQARRLIVAELEARGIPFIDTGLGLQVAGDGSSLTGLVRTTASSASKSIRQRGADRVPFNDGNNNEYATNIQISELNSINAAFAVIKWKKIRKFYLDLMKDHFNLYCISDGECINEDKYDENHQSPS